MLSFQPIKDVCASFDITSVEKDSHEEYIEEIANPLHESYTFPISSISPIQYNKSTSIYLLDLDQQVSS